MSELKLQQCRLDERYDILDCLGRGSYAEVYRARDTAATTSGAPEIVVVKALNACLQGSVDPELEDTLVENFQNEAVALDHVRHPHIINRLGHGTAIDLAGVPFHYLVFEYMPGGDLAALCRRHPLTIERTLFYLAQVCPGLTYAHYRGVIHRDVKPQNLLLTADQQIVKIADFGVAKMRLIEAVEGAITRVGTDVYAAPEHHPLAHTGALDTASLVHAEAVHLTPSADVYSLAKTTYMLLTGEAPRRFSQKPISELPPPIASEVWAASVLLVLKRATQTDPAARYQTVTAFWNELRQAVGKDDAAMLPPGEIHRSDSHQSMSGNGSVGSSGGYTPAAKLIDDAATGEAAGRPAPEQVEQPHAPLAGHMHPRIVVPLATRRSAAAAKPAASPPPHQSPHHSPSASSYHSQSATPAADVPLPAGGAIGAGVAKVRAALHIGGQARSWLVASIIITAFALMLLATHRYVVRALWPRGASSASNSSSSPLGREFVTITDVNLRRGPGTGNEPIGLAEAGSRVRVVGVKSNWYEVVVTQHGRPKEDSSTADQGWLNKAYLQSR